MRKLRWTLLALGVASGGWACQPGRENVASSSSGGGSSGISTSGDSSSGGDVCAYTQTGDQCHNCVVGWGCPQVTQCHADPTCRACLATGCAQGANALFDGVDWVKRVYCDIACGPLPPLNGNECNPVTGQSCPPHTACGRDVWDARYVCSAPPHDAALCAPCGGPAAPFCGNTLTCVLGKCARYCCDDTDCRAGAHCVKDLSGAAGYCAVTGTPAPPDCEPQVTPHTGGSCVFVFSRPSSSSSSSSSSG